MRALLFGVPATNKGDERTLKMGGFPSNSLTQMPSGHGKKKAPFFWLAEFQGKKGQHWAAELIYRLKKGALRKVKHLTQGASDSAKAAYRGWEATKTFSDAAFSSKILARPQACGIPTILVLLGKIDGVGS